MDKPIGQLIAEGLEEFANDLEQGRPLATKYRLRRVTSRRAAKPLNAVNQLRGPGQRVDEAGGRLEDAP